MDREVKLEHSPAGCVFPLVADVHHYSSIFLSLWWCSVLQVEIEQKSEGVMEDKDKAQQCAQQ